MGSRVVQLRRTEAGFDDGNRCEDQNNQGKTSATSIAIFTS